jgi:hypothetical protein
MSRQQAETVLLASMRFTRQLAADGVKVFGAGETHAGQQHRLRLLTAHRRRPADIPATAGHLEVDQGQG